MTDKDRTKWEILQALAELSNRVPFEKLTVKQICEEAQISRQTFYQYFKDKYDVTFWLHTMVIGDNFQNLGKTIGWREAYLNTFRHMEKIAPVLRQISQSDDYNALPQFTIRNCRDDFTKRYIDRYGKEPDQLMSLQIKWMGHLGTVVPMDWMGEGCNPPADEFVDQFLTLIPRDLFEALDVS